MVIPHEPTPLRSTDRATRFWIGLQVAGTLVLALAAAVLLTWLSERGGLRVRVDLTEGEQSTLSPGTLDVLARIATPVDVDIFFRPGEGALQGVVRDVQERTNTLLVLARDSAPGKVRLTPHVLSGGLGTGLARAQSRMLELGLVEIEPGGVIVVSQGARRVPLRLRGDLADLDTGDPGARDRAPVPARIVSYRGEEAFVGAILKLADGVSPKVVFLSGHGERDVAGTDERGLTRLVLELESDGFEVQRWSAESQKPLPEDGAVLALIGPEQPLATSEFEALSRFVESGGSLIAAPGVKDVQGRDALPALVERFGIWIEPRGGICRPRISGAGGQLIGDPNCAVVFISGLGLSAHPVTDGLRRADRRVVVVYSKSLEVRTPPPGGVVLPLLRTSDDCWLDLPATGQPTGNWVPDSSEPRGPFMVGIEAKFSPPSPLPAGRVLPDGARPECRVLCLGSAEAFSNLTFDTNRDLLLSLFNHAAAREFRVSVVKKNVEERRVELGSGNALATVHWVAVILLPGVCLLLGLFTAWKRRH